METRLDDKKIWFRIPRELGDELDKRITLLNKTEEREGGAARVTRSAYIAVAVKSLLESTAGNDRLRAKEAGVLP